jgi:DNA-directed RNA polymerase specialized sigma24 family protein
VSGKEREEYTRQLHARLIQLDPLAPAEFAEAFLDELFRRLKAKAASNSDETLLRDATTDALLDYIQHPTKYNPKKSALLTYLTMAAYGDLLNMFAKEKRRRRRELPLNVVEEIPDDGNNHKEGYKNKVLDSLTATERAKLLHQIEEIFPGKQERELLDLIIHRERRTDKYSEILGIQNLTPDEQRRIVKWHKDRIIKRLQRLGGKVREK